MPVSPMTTLLHFWHWLWPANLYQDPTDDDDGRDLYEDAEDRKFGL